MGRNILSNVRKYRKETRQARLEHQQALVASVERNLREAGYAQGFIDLLALAFTKKGGGAGLQRMIEADQQRRIAELERIHLAEADLHDRLHDVLGGPSRLYPRRWMGPPRTPPRGIRVDSWATLSCRCQGQCDSVVPEVRSHAAFVQWLGTRVALERSAPPPLDADELGDELESKESIVSFLRDDPPLRYDAIALFMIAKGEGQPLPIDDDALAKATGKLRQIRIDKRRRQKSASGANPSLTRSSSPKRASAKDAEGSDRQRRGREE